MARKKSEKERPRYRPIYLKQWRIYRNKTQEQVAAALGVSTPTISRIEKGTRQYTQEFLEAAADYLMTDPASLLMRDPSQPESIWSIWEQIDPPKRADALRVIRAFIADKKAG
jgi:transcriptional regulator with XRE-family HTH domain